MEWNRKFNYPTSTRALYNGKRHYSVGTEKLPSVTTILSATVSDEKKASLERWVQRVGKANAEKIKKEATTRGSSMHEFLEKFLLGQLNLSLLGDNSVEKQMADEIIENGIKDRLKEIWGVESCLYYPEKYAGAADLIAGNYEGEPAILDFKNALKPRQDSWNEDYYLQLCLYISAHNKVYNTDIKKGVILLCTKDNFFQRFTIEGERLIEFTKKAFERVDLYYSKLK